MGCCISKYKKRSNVRDMETALKFRQIVREFIKVGNYLQTQFIDGADRFILQPCDRSGRPGRYSFSYSVMDM